MVLGVPFNSPCSSMFNDRINKEDCTTCIQVSIHVVVKGLGTRLTDCPDMGVRYKVTCRGYFTP